MNKWFNNILNKYTRKEKTLLLILISLIITFLNFKYILNNKIIKYNILTEDISSLESEFNIISSIDNDEYDIRETNNYDYKSINLDGMFNLINTLEDESFQIESLEIHKDINSLDNENIIKENLNIRAKGDSISIIEFINGLEENLVLSSIENIKIYNNNGDLNLDLDICLNSIKYEFIHSYSKDNNRNSDPFNELNKIKTEDSELSMGELSNIDINEKENINYIKKSTYYPEEKEELMDIEYIKLEDELDYNEILEFVKTTNKSIEINLLNKKKLDDKFLEISYKINSRKEKDNIKLEFKKETVEIDKNCKISFNSSEKNRINIDFILVNGSEDRIYTKNIELTEKWIDYEFELLEKGFYLSEIFINLDNSKDMGTINVKIK